VFILRILDINSNSLYSDIIVKNILGFQNDDLDHAIRLGLCDEKYIPGTFTLNEISINSKFLDNPVNFHDWIKIAIEDEITLIKNIYPNYYDPIKFENIIPRIINILENVSWNGLPLKNQIWFQEYPDIIRRMILSFTIGNPDQELNIYPHLTKDRLNFIIEVIEFLDDQKLDLKDWLHLSIAAGLLGIDEKPVHAATSSIDTRMAIKLPPRNDYSLSDIERVSKDLLRAAQSKCRIDASNRFFDTMDNNRFIDFSLASLPDDYLETTFLLKFYEKLLNKYSKLKIFCIPKSKTCGNDATRRDVQDFLEKMPNLKNNNRFLLVPNGPIIGGCNLFKLSKEVLNIIETSHLIDVRGARNYEMLQCVNKEMYFGFMVCREISEAVTGLFAIDLPFVFIHQGAKERSFDGYTERYKRIENGKMTALTTVNDKKLKWE
jgi:hypothetical protein